LVWGCSTLSNKPHSGPTRAESISSIRSINRTNPTMAVSPSAHLPTTPNAHPIATGRLGDGSEAADDANEASQPTDTAAELVCSDGMQKHQPSAAHPSTTTNPTHLPTTPNPHPVTVMHLGNGVEVAVAAQQAYLPPDVAASLRSTSHDITEMECPSISNCNAEEEGW
jgi:hypothetical protein